MRNETLKKSIRIGLKRGEFALHYQPIVDLSTGQIAGNEALIRWYHEGKLVMPCEFIPICEEDANLMVQICEFVIKQSWQDRRRLGSGFISVNIAPSSLEQERFWEVLKGHCLIGDRPNLFLEFTERLLTNYHIISPHFENAKDIALGAFIDDLGVENSSFLQVAKVIRLFPNHTYIKVKLDIEFARNILDPIYRWFAKSIIDTMHNCPSGAIEVIAEGIETQDQLDIFKSLGCNYGQGYHPELGKPRALLPVALPVGA